MKNADELTVHSYKTAIQMVDLLEALGFDSPDASGTIICPFHDETEPSCQIYDYHLHCYGAGCNKHLDTIGLVQEVKGVDFNGALRWIAQEADLPEPSFNGEAERRHKERTAISDIYDIFFEKAREKAERGIGYLVKRGIKRELIEDRVGYFPVDYRLERSEAELAEKAGLMSKYGDSLFTARVVIPIYRAGRILGFYGRAYYEDSDPKHMYTKRTDPPMPAAIWNLGNEEEIWLCESIIDALTLQSHGYEGAAALFGTQGLTKERLRLLKKSGVKKVHLVFDSDGNGAGQAAAMVVGEQLFRARIQVYIKTLPLENGAEKADVNDYFKTHNRDDFEKLEDRDFFHCLIDTLSQDGTTQEQYQALAPILELISAQPVMTWESYADAISSRIPAFKTRTLLKEIGEVAECLKDKFRPLEYVEKIRNRQPVIYFNGQFYFYGEGCYRLQYPEEIDQLTTSMVGPDTKPHHVESVRKFLQSECFIRAQEVNVPNVLNLKNGLLDLNSGEFKAHTAELLSTIQAQVEFDAKATWPKWRQFLDDVLPEKDKQYLLAEIFGYCLTADVGHQVGFLFHGEGANGKSVVCDLLEALVGSDNCSALQLGDLKERFKLAELENKLVNITYEAEAKGVLSDSRFKSIVTGEPQSAERKGKDPFKFRPYCKMIVCCNTLPASQDRSYGFYRRLIILPFEKTVPLEKRNPNLPKEIINAELSGVLNWALKAYECLKKNGRFTIPAASEKALQEYREQIDPTLLYLKERLERLDDNSGKGIKLSVAHRSYTRWCESNGYKPTGSSRFRKVIEKEMKIKAQDKNYGKWMPDVGLKVMEEDLS